MFDNRVLYSSVSSVGLPWQSVSADTQRGEEEIRRRGEEEIRRGGD